MLPMFHWNTVFVLMFSSAFVLAVFGQRLLGGSRYGRRGPFRCSLGRARACSRRAGAQHHFVPRLRGISACEQRVGVASLRACGMLSFATLCQHELRSHLDLTLATFAFPVPHWPVMSSSDHHGLFAPAAAPGSTTQASTVAEQGRCVKLCWHDSVAAQVLNPYGETNFTEQTTEAVWRAAAKEASAELASDELASPAPPKLCCRLSKCWSRRA